MPLEADAKPIDGQLDMNKSDAVANAETQEADAEPVDARALAKVPIDLYDMDADNSEDGHTRAFDRLWRLRGGSCGAASSAALLRLVAGAYPQAVGMRIGVDAATGGGATRDGSGAHEGPHGESSAERRLAVAKARAKRRVGAKGSSALASSALQPLAPRCVVRGKYL